MVTLRWFILAAGLAAMLPSFGCGDSAANTAGFGGSLGTGGVGAEPDAGVNCIESGCNDGNDCTVDGLCERVTGQCIGAGAEPMDTRCGQNGIFVCDGEGNCVGCNVDEQCEAFFPDNECAEAPKCVASGCARPDPLPDGTPCSGGDCRAGACSGPWGPKQQLVPLVCGASLFGGGSFAPGLFAASMDLTVAPTMIAPAAQFSATLDASLVVPQSLLQEAVIAGFPNAVVGLDVSDARAEIDATRVASGTPVNTILNPLPQTFSIPQTSTVGDPGGQLCDADDDCPLGEFGQRCGIASRCECACQPDCSPTDCANTVTGDAVLAFETIQGAVFRAFPNGEVCFDAGGTAPNPNFLRPVRTGLRVTSNPGPLAIECEGGTVNDNGTPKVPNDDFVDPNPPENQVCFPIGSPEPAPN